VTGHVFHPGHAELHGVTVVIETHGSRTYVGRYDSETENGILVMDVGLHDEQTGVSQDEYLRRTAKFGIEIRHRRMLIPRPEVVRITRLGEVV
jgi:hypothetical protein